MRLHSEGTQPYRGDPLIPSMRNAPGRFDRFLALLTACDDYAAFCDVMTAIAAERAEDLAPGVELEVFASTEAWDGTEVMVADALPPEAAGALHVEMTSSPQEHFETY